MLFAEVYKSNGFDEKALEWYKKTLEFYPLNWTCRQNYISLLWKNNRWTEAVLFLSEQRRHFGDTPSILFFLGKSQLELGDTKNACENLALACAMNPDEDYIRECLARAYVQRGKADPAAIDSESEALIYRKSEKSMDVSLSALEQCLHDFVQYVKRDKRMTFWKRDAVKKSHTWISSPEKYAQNLLHTFMKSRFGDSVELFEEIDAGAGRVDVYVRLQGINTVIELKMCGAGYSLSYALDGIEQLAHYLENKQTYLGYLIVFDGRLRDYGKGIEPQYLDGDFTIRTYPVDVRPKIKES